MSSINTNASAMTALQALAMTQKNLAQTENQVSTGYRIGSAADNASYWSIATKMTSDIGALGSVSDALNQSSSLISTMSTALTSVISVLDTMKNDLVSAEQPGSDLSKIQTDVQAQQQYLLSIGKSANFNGQNWLQTTGGTVGLVSSYSSTSGVSTIGVDTSKTALFTAANATATGSNAGSAATAGILAKTGANYTGASVLTLSVYTSTTSQATTGDLQNMLLDVEAALSSVTSAASSLGATSKSVGNQQTYISNLSDSLTNGVSSLIDADMNQVSTRLTALQTQQQLGIQSLSIANSNTQMILKLFQ